jgi:acylphosphatase
MKTIQVIVEGRVQGVCFRDYTARQAHQLNLTGWVRNQRDGTVEAVFRGTDGDVAAMLEWLRQGSPRSKVENIRSREVAPDEDFTTFDVRY